LPAASIDHWRALHFGGASPFEKKSNKGTKTFIIVSIVVGVIVVLIIAYFILQSKNIGPAQ